MLIDIIKSLRSVHRYTDKPVSAGDLKYIVDAGTYGATLGKGRPCVLGVVDNKDLISQLARCCGSQRWIETAPVVIAVCTIRMADEDLETEKFRLGKLKDDIYDIDTNVLDILCAQEHQALIAAENMALAACELGIGSCVIAGVDVYKASKILRVPNSHLVTYLLTLGHTDAELKAGCEDASDEMIFYNTFE